MKLTRALVAQSVVALAVSAAGAGLTAWLTDRSSALALVASFIFFLSLQGPLLQQAAITGKTDACTDWLMRRIHAR